MPKVKLEWRQDRNDERWTDHTVATPFEESVAKLERLLEQLASMLDEKEKEETTAATEHHGGTLKLSRCRNSFALVDFLENDARASFIPRWFGIDSPYLILSFALPNGGLPDRSSAQEYLSALVVAMKNRSTPCLIAFRGSHLVHSIGYIGARPDSPRVLYESDCVANNKEMSKLEDFQRMFRALHRAPSSSSPARPCKMTTRLTWQLNMFVPESVFAGLRLSAVFPLSAEGAFFENELFSTMDADSAPLWTVLAVWNSVRPSKSLSISGKGSFDEQSLPSSLLAMNSGRQFVLTPLSLGLERLIKASTARSAQGTSSSGDSKRKGELVNNIARRVRSSQRNLSDVALDAANNAFDRADETNSPLGLFTIALLTLLGEARSPSDTVEGVEETQIVVQAMWSAFCSALRARFESSGAVPEHDLNPDLSRSSLHQKVTLVRFCTRMLSSKSSESSAPSPPKELDFCLVNDSNRKALAPVARPSLAWELREDDGFDELSASEVRTEMSSPPLVAEMRAFRDANPGCEFVDFVRWFSPKDVSISPDSSSVTLSPRMAPQDQKHAWTVAWQHSESDRHSSRSAFNAESRGEKALHRLETMDVHQICADLARDAVRELKHEMARHRKDVFAKPDWDEPFDRLEAAHEPDWMFLDSLMVLESRVSRVNSLKQAERTLGLDSTLVEMLAEGEGACSIKTSEHFPLVEKLKDMISRERSSLTQPDKREYIIMAADEDNGTSRLYASISAAETRVARALSIIG